MYDTPTVAPLPRLNPTLSSSSDEGPAFLSHSESTGSSQVEGYELLYSAIPPFHSATGEKMKEPSNINCPLYFSLLPPDAPRASIYDDHTEDHTYNVLTGPDDPTYEVLTTPLYKSPTVSYCTGRHDAVYDVVKQPAMEEGDSNNE